MKEVFLLNPANVEDYSIFITNVDNNYVRINENELIGIVCKKLLAQGYEFLKQEKKIIPTKYLTLAEVINMTTMSRSTIYYSINGNGFPKPVKIGRKSLWLKDDIDKWLYECKEGKHKKNNKIYHNKKGD